MYLSKEEELKILNNLTNRKQPSTVQKLLDLRENMDSVEFIGKDLVKDDLEFRPYQVVGALHLVTMKRFILGDDTGLGKTIQEILAMSIVKAKIPNIKFIIVCPKSAVLQWVSEVERFSKTLKFKPFLSNTVKANKRIEFLEDFSKDKEVDGIVTNYAMLKITADTMTQIFEDNLGYLILDEVTTVKNWSQLKKPLVCKAAEQLANKALYVHGLSATILKKSPLEVWGIFNVILPGLFPRIGRFKDLFCIVKKVKVFVEKYAFIIVGYKNLSYIKKLIKPYYYGRKKDDPKIAKFIPKIVSKDIRFDLDPGIQQKKYNEVLRGLLTTDDGREIGINNQLTTVLMCSQIVNSPELVGVKGNSSKIDELFSLLEDEIGEEKVIIFSKFKKFLNLIEQMLNETDLWGTKQPILRITGDETGSEREKNKKLFQEDPNYKILLLTTAGSEAINLQTGNTIIFLDPPITYGDFLQIVGRVNRLGSKHSHNFLYFLIANKTVDEHIIKLILKGKSYFDIILGESAPGALEFDNVNMTRDLYQMLLKDAEKLKKEK